MSGSSARTTCTLERGISTRRRVKSPDSSTSPRGESPMRKPYQRAMAPATEKAYAPANATSSSPTAAPGASSAIAPWTDSGDSPTNTSIIAPMTSTAAPTRPALTP